MSKFEVSMGTFDFAQVALTIFPLLFISPLLGEWIAKILDGEKQVFDFLKPVETAIYRLSSIQTEEEMGWKRYSICLLTFSVTCFLFVFLIQIFQGSLPFNPQNLPGVSWHLAINTAVSFITNTNWQSYGGEATMSYFTQMTALTVQNFVSAAVGIAVLAALARGIRQRETKTIGNFWVDLTRSTLYILLPLSIVLAVLLISQGVIQNLSAYTTAKTMEGASQILPMGPAASQIAIKQIGTNGGGFFNTNSAHPFENPTPFSNWLELLAILLIPTALPFTFGRMVGKKKHGSILFLVMFILLAWGLGISLWSEYSGGLMEGKETRFGIVNSVLWSVFTTDASNGSVNTMHSSLTPLSGGVALLNILLGEIIFGGVGSGLYGMVIFAILTVFIAGLMVGRTPEYLGKKIESQEVKMSILAVLFPNMMILLGTAFSVILPIALSSLSAKGPHGFTEVLYAFSSASGNNGSAFAGLNANTPYYNLFLALCMFVGRFGVIFPVLAIAGFLSQKKIVPVTSGTFGTETPIFVILLISVILIVGALTFFPALSLGPLTEHILWLNGKTF